MLRSCSPNCMDPRSTANVSSISSPRWENVALAVALIALLLFYRDSLTLLASTWSHSENYLHCWLVLPVSVWLAWRSRSMWIALAPRPSLLGLVVVLCGTLLWLAASVMRVNIVEQLALVMLLIGIVWMCWGTTRVRELAFPLCFLLFAVPFGDEFVPLLMEWTATATVALLRLTGFSVHREGMFFATTVGDFAVAEACSGVRYLMASVMAGALYAHLVLRERRNRCLLLLMAALAPLAANAIRAYLIVVIAHASNLKLAVGVDHVIYGAIFFFIIISMVFGFGEWLRRRERCGPLRGTAAQDAAADPARPGLALAYAVIGVSALGVAPMVAAAARAAGAGDAHALQLPSGLSDWHGPLAPQLAWRPAVSVEDIAVVRADYAHESLGRVTVALLQVSRRDARQKLTSRTQFLANSGEWDLVATRVVQAPWNESIYAARSSGRRLRIWWTYAAGATLTPNRYEVIVRSLVLRVLGRDAAVQVIALVRAEAASEDAIRSLASAAQHSARFVRCIAPTRQAATADCVATSPGSHELLAR